MTRRRRPHRPNTQPPAEAPPCPYCKAASTPATGADVYPHRPDLADKRFFRCAPCGAYVGCHQGTWTPLGRLANAALRQAKVAAHAAFDRLWQFKMNRDGLKKHEARGRAYAWLAGEMGIDPKDCHIGMFDVVECETATAICAEWPKRKEKAA